MRTREHERSDTSDGMSWGSVELEPEVRDGLEGLAGSEFGHAAFYVDLLAERGVLLSEPYTKQLDGKLRELHFDLGRKAMCITYGTVALTVRPRLVRVAG